MHINGHDTKHASYCRREIPPTSRYTRCAQLVRQAITLTTNSQTKGNASTRRYHMAYSFMFRGCL